MWMRTTLFRQPQCEISTALVSTTILFTVNSAQHVRAAGSLQTGAYTPIVEQDTTL